MPAIGCIVPQAVSEPGPRKEDISANKKYYGHYRCHPGDPRKSSAFGKIAKHITDNKYHTGNE
jgi:hypothetical protein